MQIEEGCLAITYNCKNTANNGVTVRVVKFVGEVEGWLGLDRWETNHVFTSYCSPNISNAMNETKLMRIDGFAEPVKAVEKEKVYE